MPVRRDPQHTSSLAPGAGVALVAVHAVIDVAVDLRVVEIVRVVATMALCALEDRIVVRIRMAGRAHAIRVSVSDRKARVLRVVEVRRNPRSGRVARRTLRRREERGLCRMPRIRRRVVSSQMAANTRQRQRRVVVVHMTGSARHGCVEACQRERRVVVVERGIRPQHGVMAQFAGRRETRMRHRRGCVVVIRLVARNTRGHRDVVVAILVATGARRGRWRHVRTHERETRRRVVELAIRPHYRVMAAGAGGRERAVIHRRLRVVVVRLVAENACRVREIVVVVGMAARAWCSQVRPRQRPACRRVIKLAIRPHHRVMALLAGGREARVIHRRFRVVVIRLVAGNARRHRDVVVVVGVAARARRGQVRPRQRPACRGVIELAIRP